VARVRLYTDEHVSRVVIRGLRQRGVDVLTVPEAGMLEALDEEHLGFARREGRVIFTQDADFLRLDAEGKPHNGIVFAPQGMPVRDIIKGLKLIHDVLEAEDMRGQVEYLHQS
jgi:predicted nuclease of predicted toxin-antitoxin system